MTIIILNQFISMTSVSVKVKHSETVVLNILCGQIAYDKSSGKITTDTKLFLSSQLTDLSQENAMLKGKILTLNETVNSTELESKASRETIMRLVSEVGKEQRDFERMQQEMDAFRSVGQHLDYRNWSACHYENLPM